MIRVVRVIQYNYIDAEAMATDMAHWQGNVTTGKMRMESTHFIPEFEADPEPPEADPEDET